jgi:hypothetical protein
VSTNNAVPPAGSESIPGATDTRRDSAAHTTALIYDAEGNPSIRVPAGRWYVQRRPATRFHFLTIATVDGPAAYPIDAPVGNWRVRAVEPDV